MKTKVLRSPETEEVIKALSVYVEAGKEFDGLLELKKEKLSDEERLALTKLRLLKSKIIRNALPKIVGKNKTNYSNELFLLIDSLKRYNKINRVEFAYMLYLLQSKKSNDFFEELNEIIKQYRNNLLQIEVKVRVRNDNVIKERTRSDTRLEDISFLSSYSYFSGLLIQAGLAKKSKDYLCAIDINDIDKFLEVCKNG